MENRSNTPLVKIPMRLVLRDYLERQLRAGGLVPETLVDGPRVCEPLVKLTFRNREYLPVDPRGIRPADQIEAPASIVKNWCQERKAVLVNLSGRRQDGRWDVYELGPEKWLGFRPWDSGQEADYAGIPKLSETEFDHCWIPVKELQAGRWSSVFYWPYWLAQRLPLSTDQKAAELARMVIELPFEDSPRPLPAFTHS
jgi:hypothetical protein